ncbi:MAG: hypothetical protein H0U55_17235, partial [Rubrobacteraceae bacterium]|nr:hypothetical protein [Rubrobacteraceae bacterium]
MKVGLKQLGISFDSYAAFWMAALVTLVVVFVGMGAIIFWRKPDDRAALYFSLTLVVFGTIWPNTLGTLANIHPVLSLLVTGLESFGLIAFFVLFYLFPNAQFVPRWTRFVAATFIVSTALATFFPGSLVDIENWPPPLNLLGTVEIAFFFGTMIYAQIYRYRRVSGAVERQQTKWVVSALLVAIVSFIGTGTLEGLPVFNQPGILAALFALSSSIGYGFAFMLVPITIGIAVLRYRLWDIDLIINRALVYGALTACIVGIYVLVVGYLGALLRTD